jgi:long-subunit acyl-CoA synthetase (AMP-forming)
LGLNLLEGYAMTEDFAFSHLSSVEKNAPGYVGLPYAGVEVRISDEGEVLIKSPGTMVGYYKEPTLTAEAFTEDGFFRTGDKGERRADGLLKLTGRVKELFKTAKGKYVAPAPIENRINEHPLVELSCVSGVGQPAAYGMVVLAEDIRGKVSDSVKEKVGAQLEKNVAAFAQLAKFSPFVAGDSLTLADCSAVTHLPLVSGATKLVYGKDCLAELPVRDYLKMMGERPHMQKVNADRKANMELMMSRMKAKS